MKALVIVPAVAAVLANLSTSAGAAVLTLSGPLSTNCYRAAMSNDARAAAIDGCTRALQEEPLSASDRAATLVNRGIVYMSGGHSDSADADFNAALRLDSALSDGWLNKGFLRLRLGQGRDALPLIQKGIDTGAEGRALAIFARGVAHEQMGNFNAAYADLRLAQRLEPRWKLPRQYLASYQVRR